MSDRSDHLIERAAALLRSANAGQVVETANAGGGAPSVLPDPPPRAGAAQGAASLNSGNAQPRFVPPPRPVPRPQLAPGTPATAGNSLVRGGSVADLRPYLKFPPIELAALERAGLMVARNSRTRTTEEYRIVIGRVLRALHEDPEGEPIPATPAPNVVMITSARPGEGKSFTALNLCGSVAQNAGESVLLVDVDAKHNSLTEQLGLTQNAGFLEMADNAQLAAEDLIIPTGLPNLAFLPLGHRASGKSDEADEATTFPARRLTPAIQRLSQRFPKSLIILDTPPCLSTSDPHTFAPTVGQVVMVVEAERTQRSEVEAAIELIHACPTVTMLLNKVRMSSGHSFGSYDYFGSYT